MLRGKNAIITGANRGIGRATVDVFAKNGASIWACSRTQNDEFEAQMKELSEKYNVSIQPLYFDVTETASMKEAVKAIRKTKKSVDILVNNAGVIYTALFQMTSVEKVSEMFEVNFYAPMVLSQYVSKIMMKQKYGSIINISSSAAIEGNAGRTAYASSKSAVITMSKVMSQELAVHGIRVNCIAPGLTETDMMYGSTPEDVINKTLERISLGRLGKPEEIANTSLYLASELSSYMTGQVLRVDGGM